MGSSKLTSVSSTSGASGLERSTERLAESRDRLKEKSFDRKDDNKRVAKKELKQSQKQEAIYKDLQADKVRSKQVEAMIKYALSLDQCRTRVFQEY